MSGFEIVELDEERREDEKWQKLVLYYLARLKGLCDWRNNSRTKIKQNPKMHLKRCSSQELESRIIDKVTRKTSRKPNCFDSNDIGCYMAAGYEEGKQQAVKIISRSLKYGVMTGILLKRGNCYRIAPEYLYDSAPEKCITRNKLSVKSVKKNVRKKPIETKKSTIYTMIRGKKQNRRKGVKRCNDETSDENPPNYKRNKRSSDTNVNLNESSNSNATIQTISRSLTPIGDRDKKRDVRAKRPRPKIQKPISYVPPVKKPRSKSQSKSPSHHTDDDEVRDTEHINANSHSIINRFRMPRPRRYSAVMSSMSSSSSLSTSYARCNCDDQNNHVVKKRRHK